MIQGINMVKNQLSRIKEINQNELSKDKDKNGKK